MGEVIQGTLRMLLLLLLFPLFEAGLCLHASLLLGYLLLLSLGLLPLILHF